MRALLVAIALAALWIGGAARAAVVSIPPEADVGLPFWCDWSYDWEARCYRDDGPRLPIGGVDDKVWRAALRFALTAIPPGASILDAALTVHHDGTCLGPRKTTRPCTPRRYTLVLHPIIGDWFRERELEYAPAYGMATLDVATRPAALIWDLTDLVADWTAGRLQNDGVLLRLADEHEAFGVGGPKLPSATFADAGLRPTLEVVYVVPS